MLTYEQIIQGLQCLGIEAHGSLLVHSSLRALGPIEGGADTLLDALCDYMQPGLLIFPSHSWAENSLPEQIFNPQTEPSCVGILSELFRQRPRTWRSLHPTHSVAAIGRGAEHYIAGEQRSRTPCPRAGCWGKLYDLDTQILFLGCDLSRNTFLHSVEEWLSIPQRLTADFVAMQIQVDKQRLDCPMKRHQSPVGDISLNYGKLLEPMLALGIAQQGQLGEANTTLAKARAMGDLSLKLLKQKPDLFLDSKAIPSELYI